MENWAEQINGKIDKKLAGTKEKEIRFFRVGELKRNISRAETFSAGCLFCRAQKDEIAGIVEKIDEAIHVPGPARREYDRIISRLSSHMQKEHGFFAPYYFSYLYSFFGMVAGLVAGYLLMRLLPEYNWVMLSAGFSAGLVVAYFLGAGKDKKVRDEKKLM